jgi:hypothetical protein
MGTTTEDGAMPTKSVERKLPSRGRSDLAEFAAWFDFRDEIAPFETPEFGARLAEVIDHAMRASLERVSPGRIRHPTAHPDAEDVLLEVAAAASQAGHRVDFVPYNENKLSQGFWHTALRIDGQLCFIQIVTNAQSRPRRRQVYAHTGVHSPAMDKYAVMIFFVAVPGYEQMTLVVPTDDMRQALSGKSTKDDRISLYIPLAYRPNDPVLDFLAYKDAWDTIPRNVDGRLQPVLH